MSFPAVSLVFYLKRWQIPTFITLSSARIAVRLYFSAKLEERGAVRAGKQENG